MNLAPTILEIRIHGSEGILLPERAQNQSWVRTRIQYLGQV